MITELMHILTLANMVQVNGVTAEFTTAALTGEAENQVLNLTYRAGSEDFRFTFTEEGLAEATLVQGTGRILANDSEGDLQSLLISGEGEVLIPAKVDPGTVHIVVQEGGSSTEIYAHAFDNREAAAYHRLSCASGSYRTSEVVEISSALADQPGFMDAVSDILRASINFSYPCEA